MPITNPGEVSFEPSNLYSIAEVQQRLGLGRIALIRAQKRGLRFAKVGRRKFARGADVLSFMEAMLATQEAARNG